MRQDSSVHEACVAGVILRLILFRIIAKLSEEGKCVTVLLKQLLEDPRIQSATHESKLNSCKRTRGFQTARQQRCYWWGSDQNIISHSTSVSDLLELLAIMPQGSGADWMKMVLSCPPDCSALWNHWGLDDSRDTTWRNICLCRDCSEVAASKDNYQEIMPAILW